MTYERLKIINDMLDKQIEECYASQRKNCEDYKRLNAPFPLRRNQRVTITLKVTKETRERLNGSEKRMKKWQEGNVYQVTGCIHDWFIDVDHGGRLLPAFFRENYWTTEEVVSIKIADKQYEGSCALCRRHKDGLCFLAGGQTISNKCATGKAGEFTCQLYEEKTELWSLDGTTHYPHVTFQRNSDRSYHIYNKDWSFYEKWTEREIKHRFLLNKPEQ